MGVAHGVAITLGVTSLIDYGFVIASKLANAMEGAMNEDDFKESKRAFFMCCDFSSKDPESLHFVWRMMQKFLSVPA